MDGQLSDFDNASMYDYQALMAAHRIRCGIKEEEITSTDDLDSLYSAMGERMIENPEDWN